MTVESIHRRALAFIVRSRPALATHPPFTKGPRITKREKERVEDVIHEGDGTRVEDRGEGGGLKVVREDRARVRARGGWRVQQYVG